MPQPTDRQGLPAALRQQDSKQERHLTIESRAIDSETRTFELALSSEYPVERYWGMEVLDHSPESIDLARLQNGAAVLVNHDFGDHVGVVESVRIDADRRVRVQVRLGNSARATDIFNDVKDGILRHVSVGYQIHDGVLEERREDGPDVYRITRWTPYEVSLVTVPADPTVGIGRSAEPAPSGAPADPEPRTQPNPEQATEERTMPEANTPAPAAPQAVDTANAVRDAREAEFNRAKAIRNIASKFDLQDDGERAIQDGASVDQFRAEALEALGQRSAAQPSTPVAHLNLSEQETKRYSLMAAMNAIATGDWSRAGFEKELSDEIRLRVGREARGVFVPFDVQVRDMTTTGAGAGAVGTDHLAGQFIENLRAASVVGQLGAHFLPGLVGNVDIPRKDASATFGWIAEGADGSESDISIGQVPLSPKTISGAVAMTRRFLKQSSPAAEAMVLSDLNRGAALGIDKAVLIGAGTATEPQGIATATGVSTQTVTLAGQPTWAEIVGFETKVDAADALMGTMGYVTTAAVKGHMKTAVKDTGSGRFLLEGGECNGYQVLCSSQLAAGQIIFGNFADVVIGMWGVLDLMHDTAAKAPSGGLVIRAFQDADIALRHPQSFTVNA